jgi:hypothetical protein
MGSKPSDHSGTVHLISIEPYFGIASQEKGKFGPINHAPTLIPNLWPIISQQINLMVGESARAHLDLATPPRSISSLRRAAHPMQIVNMGFHHERLRCRQDCGRGVLLAVLSRTVLL